MNTPTAWDLQIIDDLNKSIVRMLNIIGDSAATDMVCDTIGDSRPETVASMKAKIEAKKDEVRALRRQFPEYFGL